MEEDANLFIGYFRYIGLVMNVMIVQRTLQSFVFSNGSHANWI